MSLSSNGSPAAAQDTAAVDTAPVSVATDHRAEMDALMAAVPKKKRPIALWLAIAWVVLVVFVAVFADFLPLKPFGEIVSSVEPRSAPRLSFDQPLGTDSLGRSTLSRLIYGARQSLIVGIVSVSIAMVAGMVIGMTAGYFRRRADAVIGVVLDAMLSIPPLITLLAIAAVGKRNITMVVVGLAIVFTPSFARLARANTMAIADREFVTAAKTMNAGHLRILFRELLPQVILPISSYVFLVMAGAIVSEGSLSFLGLGIPPPNPSWGGMVNDGRPFLESAPYLVFVPAFCLVATVVSFTIVGDHARRRFDKRQSALA